MVVLGQYKAVLVGFCWYRLLLEDLYFDDLCFYGNGLIVGGFNGFCNDFGETQVNVPVESLCPQRWFYWSQSEDSWTLDDTMVVRCRGRFYILY